MLLKEKITIRTDSNGYRRKRKAKRKIYKSQWRQELISAHFEKSEKMGEFLTATDIMLAMNNALGLRLNNIKSEKALTSLKIPKDKTSSISSVWLSHQKKNGVKPTCQSYQVTLKF